jgi:hypothetical protein
MEFESNRIKINSKKQIKTSGRMEWGLLSKRTVLDLAQNAHLCFVGIELKRGTSLIRFDDLRCVEVGCALVFSSALEPKRLAGSAESKRGEAGKTNR